MMKYNKLIDHTLLKADASKDMINKLCDEAIKYNFASVCVNPTWVSHCANKLKDYDINVCTVIGFPLGANTTECKEFETKDAIKNGADEIDMVINIGALKDGNDILVYNDIRAVVEASDNKCVKVIIETCLLNKDEKIRACKLAKKAKATFVKTSTGFSTAGATIEDVKLMKETVDDMGVKAAGGVRNYQDLVDMVNAGATRIGTSKGVELLK